MNAEKILEELTLELHEYADRTELTASSCNCPSDYMLLAQKELAEDLLTKLTESKQKCDEEEQKALEEIENELLNKNRFCINGNCEE